MPFPSKEFGVYLTRSEKGSPVRALRQLEIDNICATYLEGNSVGKTASMYDLSRTLVSRLLHEQRVPMRKRGRKPGDGEDNALNIWIDRQLSVEGPTIMERRKAGALFVELARVYGVSAPYMGQHVLTLCGKFERRWDEKLCKKLEVA